jgi:hypothetical protein
VSGHKCIGEERRCHHFPLQVRSPLMKNHFFVKLHNNITPRFSSICRRLLLVVYRTLVVDYCTVTGARFTRRFSRICRLSSQLRVLVVDYLNRACMRTDMPISVMCHVTFYPKSKDLTPSTSPTVSLSNSSFVLVIGDYS